MNAFYESVAQVLEIEEAGFETRFRQTPGWCSLQAFGLLVLMENDWQAPVSIARFQELETVGDLYLEAIIAFAAEQFGVDRGTLSPDSALAAIPGWDKAGKTFMEAAGERFGVAVPSEADASLITPRYFARLIANILPPTASSAAPAR